MKIIAVYLAICIQGGFRDEPTVNDDKNCPVECFCSEKSRAICASKELAQIPLNQKSHRITYLWLKDNRIDHIDDYSFLNWMNLQTLSLQNNRLSRDNSISQRAFRPLKKLKYLYLATNDIEVVEFELPASVRMLELGNNHIVKVESTVFRHAKNLEQLYLHANRLSSKGLPSMRRLKKLNQLTLANNELDVVPRLPRSVESINLRNNRFSGKLPRTSLARLRNLRELILLENQITEIQPNALARTRVDYLDLGNNLIHSVPKGLPDTLRVLKLENNRLDVLSSAALAKLKDLAVLELHGNNIHSIDGSLRSSDLQIACIRLHNNNFTVFPEALPDSVQTLVLMHNNIKSISKRALKGFDQMTSLNIADNKLQSKKVQGGAFRESKVLESIDLHNNELHRVPSLPKTVTDLNLSGNNIQKLDKERIMRLKRLKHLNLDDNKIKRIPLEIFIHSTTLETLSLSYNSLEAIPKMLPCSLKKLYLESNEIHQITDGTFVQCQMLEEIHLKGNPLVPSKAENTVFKMLRKLTVVTIDWDYQRHEIIQRRKKNKSRISLVTPNFTALVPAG